MGVTGYRRQDMGARVVKSFGRDARFLIDGLPIVAPKFHSRAEAEIWLRGHLATLKWPRKMPCMCCRAEFDSAHKGNRLCQQCRRAPADALGDAQRPYLSRKANG